MPICLGLAIIVSLLAHSGCQQQATKSPPSTTATAQSPPPKKTAPPPPAANTSESHPKSTAPPSQKPSSKFADLVAAARETEFDLPKLDEAAILASGLRKLIGHHITIYTDLPPAKEIDELPTAFDAAVPLWCDYFSIPRDKLNDWKLAASLMKEKSRFAAVGLFPASLPEFANGYNVGSQIWLYDQPSDYYRRHLLLHEGTHAFMLRWLHGAGPPWYMEGMAELLATHHWKNGELNLSVMPANRDEVPYWGRIKMIKDDVAAGSGLSLIDVMKYDAQAHLQVEAYAWCWAATWFLDHHPLTTATFAELKNSSRDRTLEFSRRFYEQLKSDWPAITEDWQLFAADCDYGYDVPRAAVLRKSAADLPATGATVTIVTDRGWQSTGFRLVAGKKYQLEATGRYQLAEKPQPLPCEPGGITLHYHRGQPLGIVLAAVSELEGATASDKTALLKPKPIGLGGELSTTTTGTLFLKINEASSGLSDNSGTSKLTIREES